MFARGRPRELAAKTVKNLRKEGGFRNRVSHPKRYPVEHLLMGPVRTVCGYYFVYPNDHGCPV